MEGGPGRPYVCECSDEMVGLLFWRRELRIDLVDKGSSNKKTNFLVDVYTGM